MLHRKVTEWFRRRAAKRREERGTEMFFKGYEVAMRDAAAQRSVGLPITPEDLAPEWSDALDDYDDGSQEVDVRPFKFDGRPIVVVTPCFGDGETDLYRAFALS